MSAAASPNVVLVAPQMGENIGGAARAMMNCGLSDLRLVTPRDGWPNPKASVMSAHATGIIEAAKVFDSLPEAIAPSHWVIATTARTRDMNKPVLTPAQAALEARQRIDQGQQVSVLFGRESAGLQNEEIAQAHAILTVPLDPQNTSLNLAQAVLLFGYEWYQQIAAPMPLSQDPPATAATLNNFLDRLVGELDDTGFLGVPEKRASMIRNIRAIFLRGDLTDQEVQTLHGVIKFLRTR